MAIRLRPGGTMRRAAGAGRCLSLTIVITAGTLGFTPSRAFAVTSQVWTVQPSADVSGDVALYDVTATSATNAWAVGTYSTTFPPVERTLIEHWDGVGWTVQAS